MSKHPTTEGEFCWNELITADTAQAKEFYGSLLGWESQDIPMEDMHYTIFKSGDKDVCGMMQTPQGQEGKIPPHWMSYITVDDLDGMVSKAQSLGATIEVPITDVGDYGRFAVIIDPTNAHIALWQSLKSCD